MKFLKNNFILFIHLGFWVAYTALIMSVLFRIFSDRELAMFAGAMNLLTTIPMVYIFLFYLIPKYWDEKRFVIFGISVIGLVIISAYFRYYGLAFYAVEIQGRGDGFYSKEAFFQFLTGGFFILLVATPLRIIDVYIKKTKLENQLRTHKLEAELRFLKAQVNPHFLFNALNNIYSLSFTNSKKAPDMILKLSEMMSFMLYDCKEDKVDLAAEIEYLQNYISLQQLKKDGELNIKLEVVGTTAGLMITPMLFIPFYENAFKHGSVNNLKTGYLNSKFSIENNVLKFTIENSVGDERTEYSKGGVGLQNIQDRLKLLYSDAHKLDIINSDGIYKVVLMIDLNKIDSNE